MSVGFKVKISSVVVGGLKVVGTASTELVKTIVLSVVGTSSRVVATSSGFSDGTVVSGDLVSVVVVSKVVEGSEVSSCSGMVEVESVAFEETSVVELADDCSSVTRGLEVLLTSVDDTGRIVVEELAMSLGNVDVDSDSLFSEVDVEDVVVAGLVTSGGQGRSFDVALLIVGRVVKIDETDELSDVYSVDWVGVCVSSEVYSPVTTDDDDKSVLDDGILLETSRVELSAVAAEEVSVDTLRSRTSRVVGDV